MRNRIATVLALQGLLLGLAIGVRATPAWAACDTTATSNDWSTNCTTYWNANKVSRYTLAIQRILAPGGYYSGTIDGDYGTGTQSAVIAYQAAHGLSADGIVGPNTWKSLRQQLTNQFTSTCNNGEVSWVVYGTGGAFRRNTSTLVYNVLKKGQITNSCTNHYTMSTAAP